MDLPGAGELLRRDKVRSDVSFRPLFEGYMKSFGTVSKHTFFINKQVAGFIKYYRTQVILFLACPSLANVILRN
jgi:hypothetical protein